MKNLAVDKFFLSYDPTAEGLRLSFASHQKVPGCRCGGLLGRGGLQVSQELEPMNRASLVGTEWCSWTMTHLPPVLRSPVVRRKSTEPAEVPSQ